MEIVITKNEQRLNYLEDIIERGLQSFYEVGKALLEIRDNRLYEKVRGVATFETYCKERWGISKPRAYQLIDAAKVKENMSTMVDVLPQTERQVRPLTSLPPEKQVEVWKEAVETAPTIQSFDRFKAMIVGKDETAIGLNKLFTSTGHRAAKGSDIKSVCCLMLAWKLYRKDKELFADIWKLVAEINQECQIRDNVLRGIYYTEIAAKKAKLSILQEPIRAYLLNTGGLSLGAIIRKEINIIGMGGYRVESNALIKIINKQKFKKVKIPLSE